MSTLATLSLTLCYLSVAVTVISLFLPQRRTRKIFNFVIGLFVICSLIYSLRDTGLSLGESLIQPGNIEMPQYSQEDYNAQVVQKTAENLVAATDELLRAEGIEARDIRLSLKISDEGRIYVADADIYISEDDFPRMGEVESIVYRNLAKEPQVYVEKEVE